MTIQLFRLIVVASFILAQSALVERLHAKDVDQPLLDPTCAAVREAYINTHKSYYYRELIHQPFSGGAWKEFIEIIYTAANEFKRYTGRSTWQKFDIPELYPYDQRYTSCTFVDGKNGPHYYANWRKPGYRGSAEIWLTSDGKYLWKTIVRYPPDGKEFPFPTVLSVFDYDKTKAKRPDEASVVIAKNSRQDPSREAINAAYVATRGTQTYSEDIRKVETDGSVRPFIKSRVTNSRAFQRYEHSRTWTSFDPNAGTIDDRDSPKFTDCRLGRKLINSLGVLRSA